MATTSIQADQEFSNLIEQLNISMRALYAMIDTARVAAIAEEDTDVRVATGTMPSLMVHALKIIDGMGTTVDKLTPATSSN